MPDTTSLINQLCDADLSRTDGEIAYLRALLYCDEAVKAHSDWMEGGISC